jgi:hypothetical protein
VGRAENLFGISVLHGCTHLLQERRALLHKKSDNSPEKTRFPLRIERPETVELADIEECGLLITRSSPGYLIVGMVQMHSKNSPLFNERRQHH